MRSLFPLALGVFAMAFTATQSANSAENSGAVYIVAYFEAAAPDVAKVAADRRQLASTNRKEAGNIGYDAFQEISRPSRFAIFEGWESKAAHEAHRTAAATVAARDKVQQLLVGPFEIREHNGFSVAGTRAQGGRDAVFVLTHVDVFPAGKD
jgi:quinol monooxygenase YgiN